MLIFHIGCADNLPYRMYTDKNCKRLYKTCFQLQLSCSYTLGSALGYSHNARECKEALGYKKYTLVKDFCRRSCNMCGKFIL